MRLCETNFVDYWKAACDSENAEYREEHGATFAYTGIQQEIFNVVLKTEFTEANAESATDAVIEFFKARRVPLIWYTGLLCTPKDMRMRLEARGHPHDYDLTAMAIDIESMDLNFAKPDGLVVKEVRTSAESKKWVQCLASSWESPEELVPWMMANPCYNVELTPKSGKPLPRKMFVGLIDDEPVGTVMLNWKDGLIGLQTVGTSKSVRYKGIGSAVVSTALNDARAMGFGFAVVLSTVEGVKLYSKLGFKTYGKLPEHSMHFER